GHEKAGASTRSLMPSKLSAELMTPEVQTGPFVNVPLLALPDESLAAIPEFSSSLYHTLRALLFNKMLKVPAPSLTTARSVQPSKLKSAATTFAAPVPVAVLSRG